MFLLPATTIKLHYPRLLSTVVAVAAAVTSTAERTSNVVQRCWSGRLTLLDAHRLFDILSNTDPPPPIRIFNLLLQKTLKSGHHSAVISFYTTIVSDIVLPDPDAYTFGTLINCFVSFNRVDYGFGVLCDMLKRRCNPDTVIMSSLITGLCQSCLLSNALQLFDKMPEIGCQPDIITYSSLLNCCFHVGMLDLGFAVFSDMVKNGFKPDVVVLTALLDGLCKGGKFSDAAYLFFNRMPMLGCEPDSITFSVLINGYSSAGMVDLGFSVFGRMLKCGIPHNAVVFTTLISGLCQAGNRVSEAVRLFNWMIEMGCKPDVITYGTIVEHFTFSVELGLAYLSLILKQGHRPTTSLLTSLLGRFCRRDKFSDVTMIFNRMSDVDIDVARPNLLTYCVLIDSCRRELSKPDLGLGFLCHMFKHGFHADTMILTALINRHSASNASEIIYKMTEMNYPLDVITYGALINCYCHTNQIDLAFATFSDMIKQGHHCNSQTSILNILINGLCIANQVSSAAGLIQKMGSLGCRPNVITYGTLIKGLCRMGSVDEAIELHECMIRSEPSQLCQPNVITYTTIIAALCKLDGSMHRALNVFDEMLVCGVSPNNITYNHIIHGFCTLGCLKEASAFYKKIRKHS